MEDFIKALLLVADEHQATADEARSYVSELYDTGTFKFLNEEWRKQAAEQEGLAGVYKQIAERLVIAQVEVMVYRPDTTWIENFFDGQAAARYLDFYQGLGLP